MPVPVNGVMLLSGAEIARERTLGDVMADWDDERFSRSMPGWIRQGFLRRDVETKLREIDASLRVIKE